MARVLGTRLFNGRRYLEHLDTEFTTLAGRGFVSAHLLRGPVTPARLRKAALREIEGAIEAELWMTLDAPGPVMRSQRYGTVECRVPYLGMPETLTFSVDRSPDIRPLHGLIDKREIILRTRDMLLDQRIGSAALAAELDMIHTVLAAMRDEHAFAWSRRHEKVADLVSAWWPTIEGDRARLTALALERKAETARNRAILLDLADKFAAWDPFKA